MGIKKQKRTKWMTVILFCRGRNTKKYAASTGRYHQAKLKTEHWDLKVKYQAI